MYYKTYVRWWKRNFSKITNIVQILWVGCYCLVSSDKYANWTLKAKKKKKKSVCVCVRERETEEGEKDKTALSRIVISCSW